MTKEEAFCFSEVLKAYSEGKQIQWSFGDGRWQDIKTDEWHFENNMDKLVYRINPEQIRPYDNPEEFLKDQKEHGPYLISGNIYNLFTTVTQLGVCRPSDSCTIVWDRLIEEYKWQDGHICGVVTYL